MIPPNEIPFGREVNGITDRNKTTINIQDKRVRLKGIRYSLISKRYVHRTVFSTKIFVVCEVDIRDSVLLITSLIKASAKIQFAISI